MELSSSSFRPQQIEDSKLFRGGTNLSLSRILQTKIRRKINQCPRRQWHSSQCHMTSASPFIGNSSNHVEAKSLLRTCRQLHLEAAEYLYSRYLFNIIGRKEDCLASPRRCVQQRPTLSNHVHLNAFREWEDRDTESTRSWSSEDD
ncbi:unnamed protein product [Zymoseptoria tritici ST99CH_3D7]|uniref:DUF7730 domain-containing protein n=1 Tax=Zymoseptoria tritici (strain ST99CH_3D7) TaxID=1276538 RepID=A0A1X7RYE7_ZYMT9|nr:unnamed protein product [Zymoseptoria tritici ST99CH_3D7]